MRLSLPRSTAWDARAALLSADRVPGLAVGMQQHETAIRVAGKCTEPRDTTALGAPRAHPISTLAQQLCGLRVGRAVAPPTGARAYAACAARPTTLHAARGALLLPCTG